MLALALREYQHGNQQPTTKLMMQRKLDHMRGRIQPHQLHFIH